MNTPKFKIFLDLEQTIIDSFDEGCMINVGKIRNFLDIHQALDVTIFSFAIWNQHDQKEFDRRHRKLIQNVLQCDISACPSCQDFMDADTSLTGVRFDSLTDFIAIRGKVGAFTNWVRWNGISHAILVDDVVPNVDIVTRDNGDIIRFINVVDL